MSGPKIDPTAEIAGSVIFSDRDLRGREVECDTVVEAGARICSGAVIACGVRIGAGAVVAPGAVVMRHVPPGAYAVGNPARIRGSQCCGAPCYVAGGRMTQYYVCAECHKPTDEVNLKV